LAKGTDPELLVSTEGEDDDEDVEARGEEAARGEEGRVDVEKDVDPDSVPDDSPDFSKVGGAEGELGREEEEEGEGEGFVRSTGDAGKTLCVRGETRPAIELYSSALLFWPLLERSGKMGGREVFGLGGTEGEAALDCPEEV
jgi:hypothetical protein